MYYWCCVVVVLAVAGSFVCCSVVVLFACCCVVLLDDRDLQGCCAVSCGRYDKIIVLVGVVALVLLVRLSTGCG